MRININNIKKRLKQKGNSAAILIVDKNTKEQLALIENFSKYLLSIKNGKPYKSHPDIFGIWEENIEGKKIGIGQIHEFIRKAQLKPFHSSFKVGIIAPAEKMTPESQNALLKTLEEPPQNTFLILASSDRDKLLPTITSRCQIIEMSNDSNTNIDERKIKKILKSNIVDRFSFVEELIKQRNKSILVNEINNFLENLSLYFRKLLIKNKKNKAKARAIIDLLEQIDATHAAIESNVSIRLALESLMINLPLKGVDY